MSKTVRFQTIPFSITTVFVYIYLNIKTVLFQTIQFSITTRFSSIKPIDRTLSGVTTSDQSEPGSDCNKVVLRIPLNLQHYWSFTIRLFSVISRTLVGVILSLGRDEVGVLCCPSQLGHFFLWKQEFHIFKEAIKRWLTDRWTEWD